MKHIAPSTVIANVKYLHDIQTGHVIASRRVGESPWDGSWIFEACAEWFDARPDDFQSMETEQYSDGIALHGVLVAHVECN